MSPVLPAPTPETATGLHRWLYWERRGDLINIPFKIIMSEQWLGKQGGLVFPLVARWSVASQGIDVNPIARIMVEHVRAG